MCKAFKPWNAYSPSKQTKTGRGCRCRHCLSATNAARLSGHTFEEERKRLQEQRAMTQEHGRTCLHCREFKPWSEYKVTKFNNLGHFPYCKECLTAVEVSRKYDIGIDEYKAMVKKSGGKCAICGQGETKRDTRDEILPLSVDHNHDTGRVRGLLCKNCNNGIGILRDSPTILRSAAQYLEQYML